MVLPHIRKGWERANRIQVRRQRHATTILKSAAQVVGEAVRPDHHRAIRTIELIGQVASRPFGLYLKNLPF